jgi:hypothetical protein
MTHHGLLKLVQAYPCRFYFHCCVIAFNMQTVDFIVVFGDESISGMEFVYFFLNSF